MSDKEIQVGFTLLNLAGPIGNGAVGAPTPDTQKQWAQTVIDDINRKGGVRCRKLVLKAYNVNPLNQSEQQSTCLQAAQDRVFVMLDSAGFSYPATAKDCFARQGIPFLGQYGPLPAEERQYGKLMFSVDAPVGRMIHTSIAAMARRGFFDPAKGFKKLGLFVDDCGGPDLITETYAALGDVGVDKSAVDKFEFDCPSSGFAPPNQVSQAVTQHKLDGVTHVLPITGSGSFSNYTKIAQQQGFHPKYTTIDYFGLPSTSESAGTGPDAQNFDGSVMASLARWGEYNTDLPPTPGATRCSQHFAASGMPGMSKSNRNIGVVCNLLDLFVLMASKTPTLSQTTLGDGNASVGRFDAAYPSGDGVFDRAGKNSGGDFYRYIQWHADCYCWKVLEPGGPFHTL